MLLGSPKYMAPEQLLGGAVDHRCDIWALGVVIYEMAVGASPFSGDDITQIMYQIVNAAPPAPSAVRPAAAGHARPRPRARAREGSRPALPGRPRARRGLRACAAQLAAAAPPRATDDDATQTLPIGAFSLGRATTTRRRSPSRPRSGRRRTAARAARDRRDADAGPRLAISRRFDSSEAMRRLSLAGAGDEIEQTVRLDLAALAAASVPPAAAPNRVAEPAVAPRPPRPSWLLWAGVTIAALVAVAIAIA